MDPAIVTVQLEPADLRKFSKFLRGSSWRVWRLYLIALLLFGFSFFLHLQNGRHRGEDLQKSVVSWILPLAPVFLFIIVLLGFYAWWTSRRGTYQKFYPGAFLPITYTVLEEGLYSQNERGEALHFWKTIERFVETNDYFFLTLGKRAGHVIPKRCFSTPEATADFGSQARLQLEKHTPAALAGAAR
ncbi:MAG TPA: YcxB family protein [Chthoniobacter sp.]